MLGDLCAARVHDPDLHASEHVGVAQPGAQPPTSALAFDPSQLQTTGLPSNVCVLSAFPTTLAKSKSNTSFPFGIWFANPHTL